MIDDFTFGFAMGWLAGVCLTLAAALAFIWFGMRKQKKVAS